jgi:hypothetical protein
MPNELRIDAAGKVKIKTAMESAAASVQLLLGKPSNRLKVVRML